MKLLNLDPLVKSVEKRVVVVNGKNHEIRTLNVEQFLQIVDESKSGQKVLSTQLPTSLQDG